MSRYTLHLLPLAALACTGSPPEPVAPPQSKPVRVELNSSEPPSLPRLAEPEELTAAQPRLSVLEGMDLFLAVGVMNLVPAPCAPCMEDDTLGVCLLQPPPGCENLGDLLDRAIRMVQTGTDKDALRAALSYPEPWFPDPSAADDPLVVDVEVWLKPGMRGSASVFERMDAVDAAVGGVTWHLRPISEGADDVRARGLAAALGAGKGKAYMAAVGPESDSDAVVRAMVKAGMSQDVAEASLEEVVVPAASMRSKAVQASPTWFVEGYRLTGLQSVGAIGRLIQMESPTVSLPPPSP